jgi:TDG/mug DNA glycosylase family protein
MNKTRLSDHCFAPLSALTARLLILGSYPGVRSLEQAQYYAHPRNVFWDILSEIVGFERSLEYQERAAALQQSGIALWDVLYSCKRIGSLDSSIQPASIVINDFETFFQGHPLIDVVVFNGAKAEQEFRKRVLPATAGLIASKQLLRLPSTSPAMASMTYAKKLESWKVIKDYLQ